MKKIGDEERCSEKMENGLHVSEGGEEEEDISVGLGGGGRRVSQGGNPISFISRPTPTSGAIVL